MIQQSHLQAFDLTLTTQTPLYIGSGITFKKHEYYYNASKQTVSMLDQPQFFQLLADHQLLDAYEAYIFEENRQDLQQFLQETCSLTPADIQRITRYTVHASDALDACHTLKEIHAFMRAPNGQAYIPGSSVKGALRTVLLAQQMMSRRNNRPLPDPYRDYKGYEMARLEGQYFNTLNLGVRNDNPVTSIFRGISISDSAPVSDAAMALCKKIDVFSDGSCKELNLCRECIRPGTEIHFRLTLDQSVLKGSITPDTLRDAIATFSSFYQTTYVEKFSTPANAAPCSYQNCLILGGGAGFFSKTITYPYLKNGALPHVASYMTSRFPGHHHDSDVVNGISPHMLKYTQYQGKLYPFGVCEVSIL